MVRSREQFAFLLGSFTNPSTAGGHPQLLLNFHFTDPQRAFLLLITSISKQGNPRNSKSIGRFGSTFLLCPYKVWTLALPANMCYVALTAPISFHSGNKLLAHKVFFKDPRFLHSKPCDGWTFPQPLYQEGMSECFNSLTKKLEQRTKQMDAELRLWPRGSPNDTVWAPRWSHAWSWTSPKSVSYISQVCSLVA